jgi:hypothetical protein
MSRQLSTFLVAWYCNESELIGTGIHRSSKTPDRSKQHTAPGYGGAAYMAGSYYRCHH